MIQKQFDIDIKARFRYREGALVQPNRRFNLLRCFVPSPCGVGAPNSEIDFGR